MKTYSLLAVQNGFCFCDTKTGKYSEKFYNKAQAVKILLTSFLLKNMDAENALDLLREVVALPYFPITDRVPGKDPLDEDLFELDFIKMIRHVIGFLGKLSDYEEPTVVLCSGCGKHAHIIGRNLMSAPFYSKEIGRDIITFMKDNNAITLADELRLSNQLKEINLPEKPPEKQNGPRSFEEN